MGKLKQAKLGILTDSEETTEGVIENVEEATTEEDKPTVELLPVEGADTDTDPGSPPAPASSAPPVSPTAPTEPTTPTPAPTAAPETTVMEGEPIETSTGLGTNTDLTPEPSPTPAPTTTPEIIVTDEQPIVELSPVEGAGTTPDQATTTTTRVPHTVEPVTTTTTTRVPPTAEPVTTTTTRVPPTAEPETTTKTRVVELLPVESVVTVVTTLNEEKPGDELKQIETDTAVVAAQSSSDCLTTDIEVPMEVCEDSEVCEPKSSMECNIEYEEICTEVEQETCEKVTTCKTVYKNVCEGGVCTPQLINECSETDEVVCDGVILVPVCNLVPHEVCKLVDTEECGLKTTCRQMIRTLRQVQCS